MKLKDASDNVVNNVKDTLNEDTHKSAANGEQTKRDVAGRTMTPGENTGSMFKPAKNSVQGEADVAKRDFRNS